MIEKELVFNLAYNRLIQKQQCAYSFFSSKNSIFCLHFSTPT
jgi:hypothetical protein